MSCQTTDEETTSTPIQPQPKQWLFHKSPADICVFGGSAGGGKTYALLTEPLRHRLNPRFGGVIFRQSYTQITMEGGMWDEASSIYPSFGGEPRVGRLEWHFPSGAKVSFAYLEREADKLRYDGAQIAYIGFDQAEVFSEGQIIYLLGRNRSTCGVKPYMRLTCNPDPDCFLAKFLDWWIADDGYADLNRAGKLRWMVRVGGRIIWADTAAELAKYDQRPKSVTFIPATIYDNKILLEKDPGYLANLQAQLPVDKARLLGDAKRGGNWKVRPEAGKVFNRAWFEIVEAAPAEGIICRFWDFAATEKDWKGPEPAFTASVKMKKHEGTFYILDCVDVQKGPAVVDRMLRNLSQQDATQNGRYLVRWEIEPGSAGKRENARLIKMLAGLNARGVRPSGDKLTRAKPLAIQAQAGNVKLVRGAWNERWLNHMHHQPDIKEKDIMDASSGAFHALAHMGGVWRG